MSYEEDRLRNKSINNMKETRCIIPQHELNISHAFTSRMYVCTDVTCMTRILQSVSDVTSTSHSRHKHQEKLLHALLKEEEKDSVADIDPALLQFVFGTDQTAASDFLECTGRCTFMYTRALPMHLGLVDSYRHVELAGGNFPGAEAHLDKFPAMILGEKAPSSS